MLAGLHPFLPALDNPSVFFAAVALLLGLLSLSLGSMLLHRPSVAVGARVKTLKTAVAIPAWSLITLWFLVGGAMLAFAGAMAGSVFFTLVAPLVVIAALVALTALLVAWVRSRSWADWLVLLAVLGFSLSVALVQRLWICEPLAWSGLASAQHCAAELYVDGEQGAIRDVHTAAGWYERAAEQGSEAALASLAKKIPSKLTRKRILHHAAEAGNEAAAWDLFLLLGIEEGSSWLHLAIENGHPEAIYQQSKYMHRGVHGFAQNEALAWELWLEAAEKGSQGAAAELALVHERGDRPVGYSREQSLYWGRKVRDDWAGVDRWQAELSRYRKLRDDAAQGEPKAIFKLAMNYEGRASRDAWFAEEARKWLTRAAEAGVAEAQFKLAHQCFEKGEAMQGEQALGRKWITAAADQRHRYALSNIAYYLEAGQHGFEPNLTSARSYAETLLEVLDADKGGQTDRDRRIAEKRLANLDTLIEEERIWKNGLADLETRAAQGEGEAQYLLFEKHSQDIKRGDRNLAWDLLQQAAEQGHLESRYRVASRTLTQPRTDEEEARAYAWMQDAAARGHRGAMVHMGRVYMRGMEKHGIAKNLTIARTFLEKSLEGLQGDIVYQRKSGSRTVMTKREGVESALASITDPVPEESSGRADP